MELIKDPDITPLICEYMLFKKKLKLYNRKKEASTRNSAVKLEGDMEKNASR